MPNHIVQIEPLQRGWINGQLELTDDPDCLCLHSRIGNAVGVGGIHVGMMSELRRQIGGSGQTTGAIFLMDSVPNCAKCGREMRLAGSLPAEGDLPGVDNFCCDSCGEEFTCETDMDQPRLADCRSLDIPVNGSETLSITQQCHPVRNFAFVPNRIEDCLRLADSCFAQARDVPDAEERARILGLAEFWLQRASRAAVEIADEIA